MIQKKIRVLILIDSMIVAGAEAVVRDIVNRIDRERFDVWLGLLFGGGELLKEVELPSDRIACFNFKGYKDFHVYYHLYSFICQHRFDIVHTHIFPSNTVGRMIAFLAGVPVIISTEHNEYHWKNYMHIMVDWLLSHVTNAIVTVSESVSHFAAHQALIQPDKFRVIYNGVNTSNFVPKPEAFKNEIREGLGISSSAYVIGTVGSMTEQKGHCYLVEAALRVVQSNQDAVFILIGDGPLRKDIETRINEYGLKDQVKLLGIRRDVQEILAAMDLFVFPSLYEGLGIAVLEAQAMALPVVVTSLPAVMEIISDGENGKVVRPKDSVGLADAIISLIQSPERASAMGEKGREKIVNQFSLDSQIEKIESLYLDCYERSRHTLLN